MAEPWPLSRVRVLDASTGISGAYCTKLLADAGADVVKAELTVGDPLRGEDALFAFLHTSKRSVCVDESEHGETMLDDLVQWADIVVTNDGPGIAGRLGDAAAVQRRNPVANVVSLSWFGAGGPWTGRPANEFTLQAWCGSIASRGRKHEPPIAAGGRVGEWAAGAAAAVAALALWRTHRLNGGGGSVDISVLEAMTIAFNQFQAVAAQFDGLGPEPVGIPRVVDVPSVEPTSDGWVGFATVRPAHFRAFADLTGHPEWADDPELARFDRRPDHDDELSPVIAAWTSAHTVEEVLEAAGARHIPVAPIGNGATLPTLDYFRERQVFVTHPGGRFQQPRVPYRFTTIPHRPFRAAPALGEHTASFALSVAPRTSRSRRPAQLHATQPCAGLRVFDLTSTWAGPYASQILGFLGADVIKVESMQRPDGTRMSTAYATVGDRPWELAPLFHSVNTTKRGITLDLTRPEGRDLARRLLETCDVLVENFTPRVLDNFDLVNDDLLATNPGLIVVRMPAWGLDGAWRERPGFAQTMEQVSGLAWVTGFADGPPVVPRGPCDPLGGWHAAFAVLAALEQRERTGLGTLIEAPLVEGALNIAAGQLVEYSAHGQLTGRTGNRSPTAAPQNVYRARGDERWLALSVETDEQWVALRGALGDPAWACDSALDHIEGRLARVAEIDRELGALFADAELDDLVDRLWSAGVAVAPVINARRVVENAQHAARGFYEQVCHEVAGVVALPRFPGVWAGRTDPWHWRPAPTLGQHNTEVLGSELDLAPDELEQLERHKIIGTRPVLTEG